MSGALGGVLVFSRTTGYRHACIPAGIAAIGALRDAGLPGIPDVEATEDAEVFTAGALARYGAVVFLNTSGTVLDTDQREALAGYVRGGGGFVGVHGAADTEYDWPGYAELVGAYFDRHPQIQPATIRVEDPDHPATAGLAPTWTRTDEWYDFRTNPRPRVQVLLTVDESSYEGGRMGSDHPIAWCREYGLGRAFYTACGHTVESYAEPAFRAHLAGGIRYAASA
jgi:type 1 glutamine amidotransferase